MSVTLSHAETLFLFYCEDMSLFKTFLIETFYFKRHTSKALLLFYLSVVNLYFPFQIKQYDIILTILTEKMHNILAALKQKQECNGSGPLIKVTQDKKTKSRWRLAYCRFLPFLWH